MVHIVGRTLVDVAVRVLEGILACPYSGCKLITIEIFEGSMISLVAGVLCCVVSDWVKAVLWFDIWLQSS